MVSGRDSSRVTRYFAASMRPAARWTVTSRMIPVKKTPSESAHELSDSSSGNSRPARVRPDSSTVLPRTLPEPDSR